MKINILMIDKTKIDILHIDIVVNELILKQQFNFKYEEIF